MKDYPSLEALLSGYFHQDWPLEGANPDEIISNYLASEPREVVAAAQRDIQELLRASPDEDELSRIVTDDLGSFYDPRSDHTPVRDWLRDIDGRLTAWLQNPSS